MRIVITSKGFRGTGRYIGRHKNPRLGVFGNPFPTKKSKFSKKVFTLKESLTLYSKWIKEQYKSNPLFKEEVEKLLKELKQKGEVVLDCWCVDLEIRDISHQPTKCHGEVLAVFLLTLLSSQSQSPFPSTPPSNTFDTSPTFITNKQTSYELNLCEE